MPRLLLARLALLLLLALTAVAPRPAAGQPRRAAAPTGIAYYDVDRLYDTLPSPFYDDDDYTPAGRLRWTAARYRRKIDAVAAVVDSMAMPLTALWGVENEAVVRDIAAAAQGDYVYLHRTLVAPDGLDFALLYHGDRFFPHYDEAGRRYLYVEGTLRRGARRDTVGLLLCAEQRMIRPLLTALRAERPGIRLVVAGRSEGSDAGALGLRDIAARAAAAGRGTVAARSGWRMRDRILADTALRMTGGEVYARPFLFDPATGLPRPTYDRRRYIGGAGGSLPVYAYFP